MKIRRCKGRGQREEGGTKKRCSRGDKCMHPDGPVLPLSEFHNNKASRDGKANVCKKCNNEYVRKYYATQEGRERMKKASSKYTKTEKGKASQHRYYLRKKEKKNELW